MNTRWTIDSFLLENVENLSSADVARTLVLLFERGDQAAFVARYREEEWKDGAEGNPFDDADVVKAYAVYKLAKDIKEKGSHLLRKLTAWQLLTGELTETIQTAKTLEAIESIESLYDPQSNDSKMKKVKRAIEEFGLKEPAENIMAGRLVDIEALINRNINALKDTDSVEHNIKIVISDMINKLKITAGCIADFVKDYKHVIALCSKFNKRPVAKYAPYNGFKEDILKLEDYSNQVLAINRGEQLGILKVDFENLGNGRPEFGIFVKRRVLHKLHHCHKHMLTEIIDHCYENWIEQRIKNTIRADLTRMAQVGAVDIFARNLRQKLLHFPYKAMVICGIDPGFKNGCKTCIIDTSGQPLDKFTFFADVSNCNQPSPNFDCIQHLRSCLCRHNCKLIGIGNGSGYRNVLALLSKAISSGFFGDPNIEIVYVDEAGSSIYSVSDGAHAEFAAWRPIERSALSIARRLQDPLAELVKYDPKTLGIGEYQYSITDETLNYTLD